MADAKDLAALFGGRWVKDEDVYPATNIIGRRFWAPGAAVGSDIEGVYQGFWPTHGGVRPQGLYWFFEQ